MSNRWREGVRIAINREAALESLIAQLAELDNQQLSMVSDYIWGLKAADNFLSR